MIWKRKVESIESTHIEKPNLRVVEEKSSGPGQSSELDFEDIIAEAEVYWAYGKWHDALALYQWWLESNGAGSPFNQGISAQKSIAEKAIDCTIQARDSDYTLTILNIIKDAKYPDDFILQQSILALKRDPSNFKLIQFCNYFDDAKDTINSIVKEEEIRKETMREKKDKMWKKSALDANRISTAPVSRVSWSFVNSGTNLFKYLTTKLENPEKLDLLKLTKLSDDLGFELSIIANMVGTSAIGEDRAGSNDTLEDSVFASVKQSMYDELEVYPENLGIHVELLKILHDRGLTEEYSIALLRLVSVLNTYSAGTPLKRRLLSAGKILGYSPLWDTLSSNISGLDIYTLNRRHGVYMSDKFEHRLLGGLDIIIENKDEAA